MGVKIKATGTLKLYGSPDFNNNIIVNRVLILSFVWMALAI